ncbi:GNAT family N-acetyltransferase [Plantactinospora sp. KLBMP9567]|uniref:GNAT family N-acetyltransferase n=1 Tax=Plantactinospora sp. KLBMP9567 TaxID=3085900 RepID=UPI003990D191
MPFSVRRRYGPVRRVRHADTTSAQRRRRSHLRVARPVGLSPGWSGDDGGPDPDLGRRSGSAAYVADAQGDLHGVIAVHICPFFERDGAWGRIVALVVSDRVRGRGVGSRVVAAAEYFAASHGCLRMEVTSGDRRPDAHKFYQRRGYADQAGNRSASCGPTRLQQQARSTPARNLTQDITTQAIASGIICSPAVGGGRVRAGDMPTVLVTAASLDRG